MKKILLFLCFLLPITVSAADIETEKVLLRGVDKITGRVSTMEAAVGEEISFGHLVISIEKCYTKPPEETPENSAYLVITEKLMTGKIQDVFSGWMFSSNPALSAMEHPVYDIWVLSCMNESKPDVQTLMEQQENAGLPVDEFKNFQNLPEIVQP